MLVTAIVFLVLSVVATSAMLTFLAMAVLQAAVAKGGRVLDRRLRKLQAEQYVQLVSLPLCAAIVGGLVSTAISIFVDYPPWKHDSRANVVYILIAIALFVGTAGPLAIRALYADPKNLLIGQRIDRLKDGDWAHDSKAEVINTIDKNRAVIKEKLNSKGIWFVALLMLVIASDAGWLVLDYVEDGVSPGVITTLVMAAAILSGLVARYWMWPMYLRSTLKDLDSYRAEADALSPPAFTAPRSPASAVHHRYDHHDLRMAVGGLLVGAILARLSTARSRGQRQG